MIRWGVAAVVACSVCFGAMAEAADLPVVSAHKLLKSKKAVKAGKKAGSQSPTFAAAVLAPQAGKPKRKISVVAKPNVAADNDAEKSDDGAAVQPALAAGGTVSPESPPESAVDGGEINLSWFVGPLVANADGPKREGSSSIEGNLIVAEPGYVTSPYMVIELSGHIVKTTGTSVRLDVQVGNVRRTVSWKTDEEKAGRFELSINAPMAAGELPGYFPVSALAFVTREGKIGAAMVSLEKVKVRVGRVNLVAER